MDNEVGFVTDVCNDLVAAKAHQVAQLITIWYHWCQFGCCTQTSIPPIVQTGTICRNKCTRVSSTVCTIDHIKYGSGYIQCTANLATTLNQLAGNG